MECIEMTRLTCDYRFKVIALGDNNVGKTTLLHRYMTGIYKHHYATIGVDFFMKVVQWSDFETVQLQVWDTAGHESYTSMLRPFYREAKGCLIMFDVGDTSSFQGTLRWKKDLDREVALRNGSPVPCILLANKCDLSPWAVTKEEIDQFSKENAFIGWIETSVKENKNVNECMRVLVEKMLDTADRRPTFPRRGDSSNLREGAMPGSGCF